MFGVQVRRVSDTRAVPRAGARVPPAGGHAGPPGGHAGSRPRGAGPLPPSCAGRGRPHAGHGFRAADSQDCRKPHDAQDWRATDAHVLSYFPQTDPSVSTGFLI